MVKKHTIAVIILAGFLASCDTLGIPPADTFNKKVATAQQTDTAVLQSAFTLAQNNVITPDQLKRVEAQTDNAQAGIDLARQLHKSNPSVAEGRVGEILALLESLQEALASPNPGSALPTVLK